LNDLALCLVVAPRSLVLLVPDNVLRADSVRVDDAGVSSSMGATIPRMMGIRATRALTRADATLVLLVDVMVSLRVICRCDDVAAVASSWHLPFRGAVA
jgi:hypothetical protein